MQPKKTPVATAAPETHASTPETHASTPEIADSGLAGSYGFGEVVTETASDKTLLQRAQVKAPKLTQEFIDTYGLTVAEVEAIADGTVSPPPAIGPERGTDLYLTPGGWVQTLAGVSPEKMASAPIAR